MQKSPLWNPEVESRWEELDSGEEENEAGEALQDQNELDWHVNWVFKVLEAIKKR